MKDWQERVSDERDELAAKHNKLCKFLDSAEYAKLRRPEQDDLVRQADIMAKYHSILTDRMARFQ